MIWKENIINMKMICIHLCMHSCKHPSSMHACSHLPIQYPSMHLHSNPCIQPCMHCSFILPCMHESKHVYIIHPPIYTSIHDSCMHHLSTYLSMHPSKCPSTLWCLSVCSSVRTVLSSYSTVGPEGSWSSCFFYIFLILNMKVFYLSCSTVWPNTD